MKPHDQDRSLSTREVAERCGTSESTVRYSARMGTLRGSKVQNAWRFDETDATWFCQNLHERRKKALASISGSSQRSFFKRGIDIRDLVNYLAALVTIATFLGLDRNHLAGIALAAVNIGWVAVGYVRTRSREPSKSDIVRGTPVDPAAVTWTKEREKSAVYQAGQTAATFLAVGFITYSGASAVLSEKPGVTGQGGWVAMAPERPASGIESGDFDEPVNVEYAPPEPTSGSRFPEVAGDASLPQADAQVLPTAPSSQAVHSTEPPAVFSLSPTDTPPQAAAPPADPSVPGSCGQPPDASFLEWGGESRVTVNSLNLRAGPSTDCLIVRTLTFDELVILRSDPYLSEGAWWVFVVAMMDGSSGWVQSSYLRPVDEGGEVTQPNDDVQLEPPLVNESTPDAPVE